ncbi:hypothetical protein [Microbacterium sp. NPDC055683]
MILVALSWDRYYASTGWIGVAIVLLLVVLPFAIAYWLTSTCTAWNGTVEGRCKKPRHGVRRCEIPEHGRAAQLVTFPEVMAALSLVVGVANVVILLGAAM